ncbi:MAG: nicotinate (nicotinamide) nucleotide adenylyltransferase [Bryobacterales bacterium]|nr:nicotinate (nicotinamide) nucleotide adenylyltransferase [Bryobacterales bacterium]
MRIALFGGTFDPVHRAHLIVAREAADEFQLDQVWFVPAAHPPHKSETNTPYEHRMHMVELACREDARFIASRLEQGAEKSYSFYTIHRARTAAPAAQLYFLIGADAFAEISTWHRTGEVVAMVDFIVVTRPGHNYVTPPGARVHRLESLALHVSSSDIRRKLTQGLPTTELPLAVRAYIQAHGLYAPKLQ